MKKFILRTSIFVFLLLVIITLCCMHMHKYLSTHVDKYMLYTHEVNYPQSIDKLKIKTKPSIIIIGGSGCGFGFLSEELFSHYDMPVINTGTYAGFGLHLMLEAVRPYISENDIILLIPEYDHFNGSLFWGKEGAIFALYSKPEISQNINPYQFLHLLKYYPQYIKNTRMSQRYIPTRNPSDTIGGTPYDYCSLNEYGDITFYEKRLHRDNIEIEKAEHQRINKYAMLATKDFILHAQEKGATCIFLPPAYLDAQYDLNAKNICKIANLLASIGIPYQADPKRYRMPDTLFYDTPYHLTYEGCVYRTNLVIEDIDYFLHRQ